MVLLVYTYRSMPCAAMAYPVQSKRYWGHVIALASGNDNCRAQDRGPFLCCSCIALGHTMVLQCHAIIDNIFMMIGVVHALHEARDLISILVPIHMIANTVFVQV